MDFLAISGCDTNLYHSHGGATYGTIVMRSRERIWYLCVNLA